MLNLRMFCKKGQINGTCWDSEEDPDDDEDDDDEEEMLKRRVGSVLTDVFGEEKDAFGDGIIVDRGNCSPAE